jgi:hypothetical protein
VRIKLETDLDGAGDLARGIERARE